MDVMLRRPHGLLVKPHSAGSRPVPVLSQRQCRVYASGKGGESRMNDNGREQQLEPSVAPFARPRSSRPANPQSNASKPVPFPTQPVSNTGEQLDWRAFRARLVAWQARTGGISTSSLSSSSSVDTPRTSSNDAASTATSYPTNSLFTPSSSPAASSPSSSASASGRVLSTRRSTSAAGNSNASSASPSPPSSSSLLPRPTPGLLRPSYPPTLCSATGSWAHTMPHVEPGCLLLARQPGMQFFTHSVILITSHDEARGSLGYVINKPSPLTISEMSVHDGAAGFKNAFGSQRLHLGGPIHLDHVTLLHRFRGMARAQEISEGVYLGGLPAALEMVQAGLAKASDFRLMIGMSGWGPGQLKAEIARGLWHVVSASPDLCLPWLAPPLLPPPQLPPNPNPISGSGTGSNGGLPPISDHYTTAFIHRGRDGSLRSGNGPSSSPAAASSRPSAQSPSSPAAASMSSMDGEDGSGAAGGCGVVRGGAPLSAGGAGAPHRDNGSSGLANDMDGVSEDDWSAAAAAAAAALAAANGGSGHAHSGSGSGAYSAQGGAGSGSGGSNMCPHYLRIAKLALRGY